jgi:ankyrin repeat protein
VAAANGNMDSTLRLLAAGADATLTNDNGDTPADLAQRAEAQEVARMLERHVDAPATPVSAHARGPLLPTHEFFVAVGQLDLERVRELLEEDPSLVDADVWGDASVDGSWGHGSGQGARGDDETARAVHFAAYKHAELLRLLIEYDADLDAHGYCENQYGMTSALVLACWEGDMETVRLLLEAGADPNNPGTPAASPIHCGGHLDLEKVELMVQYGARHDIFSAAAVGDLDEVKRLLTESPGSIDAPDPFQRRSPLGWAVHYGRDEVAEYLSDAGAKATPQELISLGRTDEIRQLVEDDPGFVNRREVGGRDNEDPPLIWALRGGQRELVEFLLSAGADPNMHGDWETPLSLACGDVDMATLLIDAGADVNLSMFPGWTMLSKAVHRRGFEVAELLLRRGAEIDRVAGEGGGRKGGRTALQVAVGECREPDSIDDCLEKLTFLFAHGADVNVLSDDGKTALDIQLEKAGQSRYNFPSPEIAELLREHGGRRSAELDS